LWLLKKIHFEEQALVTGNKQSSQADKEVRLTRQASQQGCWACRLYFVAATSSWSSK